MGETAGQRVNRLINLIILTNFSSKFLSKHVINSSCGCQLTSEIAFKTNIQTLKKLDMYIYIYI